jgi:hypothetical protein
MDAIGGVLDIEARVGHEALSVVGFNILHFVPILGERIIGSTSTEIL